MSDQLQDLIDQVQHVAKPAREASPIGDFSEEAIERRKRLIVEAGARIPFNPRGPNPKQSFRTVCCRLLLDPTDAVALDYIPVGLRFREKGDTFGKSALSRIFCQFRDDLPDDTHTQILDEVTTYEGWLTGGTENHIAMRRTAAFLFAEAYPEATFAHGLKGRELADECLRYFREYGQLLYRNSMVEFLSPIYHACHTAAWLNVYDFAESPEAKQCARAILDWMFADLAVNSHHGVVIPPAARAKGLMTDSYQLSTLRSNTQWTAWLYWGAGNVDATPEAIAATDTWHQSPLALHAVSSYVPETVIRRLGAKEIDSPYSLLQGRANREVMEPPSVNAYGKTEIAGKRAPDPRYVTRSVYVNRDYAIGAGTRAADIHEPTVRHAHTFGIIWKDRAPRNWMFFVHPYWYVNRPSDETGEPLGTDDWSGTSPFLQMVHWQNAAVLLANLPEDDPYHGQAVGNNPKWISDRPQKLIQRLCAYVPDTIDESVERGGNVFVRSGDVYVGMRPVGGQLVWEDCGRTGYRRLALEGEMVAVAVEIGDLEEYGSLDSFVDRVSGCDLDTREWSAKQRVVYTTSRGDRLDIEYDEAGWRPVASVNDVPLDYATWPTCESPYLTCRDGVMCVNDGREGFEVDWSDTNPHYRSTRL